MSSRVLFVDDDVQLLAAYKLRLGRRFEITTAPSGAEGLQALEEAPVAVVVSDQNMVSMNGVQFLGEVRKRSPDTVRMMLTGNSDLATAGKAVNEGRIFRFFTKPCPPDQLANAIEDGLKQYNLARAERELLEQTLAGSVRVLIDVLSLVNPEAFQNTQRLRSWARAAGRRLNLLSDWEMDVAAMLSPIGLITIPPEIYAKVRDGAKLEQAEREIYERTPEVARNLLSNIPRMKNLSEVIFYQNKGFDGSGFPDNGVAGGDIPLGGRLLKVLIDLAAMTDGPDDGAFAEMEKQGHLYDPEVLRTVRSVFIDEKSPNGGASAQKTMRISAADLSPGVRLAANIETLDGTLLLAAGSELSLAQIERLWSLQKFRKLREPLHIFERP